MTANPTSRTPLLISLGALAVVGLLILAVGFSVVSGPELAMIASMGLMMLLPVLLLIAVVVAVLGLVRNAAARNAPVQVRCRGCGGLNPEDARYCNACGEPL